MNQKQRDTLSKFLSYVLRHAPESIDLSLDRDGWADVDALIHGAGRQGHAFDLHALREVVETNDKRRFTLSDDGRLIRAAQGHSSNQVEVRHVAKAPPSLLYHGTASRFLASIEAQGLIPGSRHHVHLSEDPQTALAVGKRYGQPVLLTVDTQAMCAAGAVFYQADNGVWLVDQVPPVYLSRQAEA